MTLIEVMAGLALLASLLVTILLARSRYTRQAVLARQRIEAAAVADRLLARWWEDVDTFPRDAAGRIAGSDYLAWRTRPVPNEPAESLDAQVVRLELVDRRLPPGSTVLVTVDVLLPQKEPAP